MIVLDPSFSERLKDNFSEFLQSNTLLNVSKGWFCVQETTNGQPVNIFSVVF